MGTMMLGTPLTMQAFLTDISLGNAVGDVLFEDSPATAARVMANRAVISSGLATLSVANEWMPTIRATVFGIMLFMTPIALLFILTPINLRVASFAFGLFVFVAMWGVVDAGIYQLTLGRATAVLAEMRANHVGANAWMLAPSSAMKALAIFGSFRTAAAGLAGAFTFTVFRFSGNVFSSFTGEALQAQGMGTAAASPLLTREGLLRRWRRRPPPRAPWRAAGRGQFGDFGERLCRQSLLWRRRRDNRRAWQRTCRAIRLCHGRARCGARVGRLCASSAGRDLSDPATARAVRANATTSAIQNFAEKDALRALGMAISAQARPSRPLPLSASAWCSGRPLATTTPMR
jgi:conjugal transfer mating pair stabilization protein TraG